MAIIVYENFIEQVCNRLPREREPAKKVKEIKVSYDIILVWKRQKLGEKDEPADTSEQKKGISLYPLVKYAFQKPKNGVPRGLSYLCQYRICKRRPYKGGIYPAQGKGIGMIYPRAKGERKGRGERKEGQGGLKIRTGQGRIKNFLRGSLRKFLLFSRGWNLLSKV